MELAPAALHSPAAERNKEVILEALLQLLPEQGIGLEIASGSGQHIAHFSAHMPGWNWLASDPAPEALASIAAWHPLGAPGVQLDVLQTDWALPTSHRSLDALYCANMLHISPWQTCAALMRGAAHHLDAAGLLLVYGPFIQAAVDTAPSNQAFDADLRRRNPAWGLRHLDDVAAQALACQLQLRDAIKMPANNLLLVFEQTSHASASNPVKDPL
ncbi:class I SAM-dependent methyltransferase [Paucibacter sp. B2R-40]|uniref:class I SAM-dependent methyltransferase n=1 Tax=Paucibacter sp. B2R-40 TaxID=2893554 RepID=UPI0021E50CEC|nr:class I SAM-dependent methyltransferase [Paucibacter sp. B2R-40]MCV2353906.1 class I SAM-dependent methyltransferase [Paucibacter sp. B2R-40]